MAFGSKSNQVAEFANYELKNGNRSLDEAISEVERECEVRCRCFDKWVAEGRISKTDAKDRLERMISALKFLHKGLDKPAE